MVTRTVPSWVAGAGPYGRRDRDDLLSQIIATAVGRGWAYYAMSLTITVVLALAANTSFRHARRARTARERPSSRRTSLVPTGHVATEAGTRCLR